MDEIIADRWAALNHLYFVDHPGAAQAVALFHRSVRSGRPDLHKLLRHHEERAISDRQTWQRDHFDSLLAYFSMAEVGCLAGFVPGNELPHDHVQLAREVLGHPAVRRYYEDNYPLLLPRAHRIRIEGQEAAHSSSVDADASEGAELFDEFLLLSQPIETGASLETFLWFLDGGARDGFDLDDTIRVLGEPELLLRHTSRSWSDPDGLDPLSASVQGFLGFVDFAPRFLDLLESAAAHPLLQSAMWHYHGYWLSRMNQYLGSEVRRALRALGASAESGQAGETWEREMVAAARRERDAQELALARLSTGRFEYPLSEFVLLGSLPDDVRPGAVEFSAEILPAEPKDDEEEGTARGTLEQV